MVVLKKPNLVGGCSLHKSPVYFKLGLKKEVACFIAFYTLHIESISMALFRFWKSTAVLTDPDQSELIYPNVNQILAVEGFITRYCLHKHRDAANFINIHR